MSDENAIIVLLSANATTEFKNLLENKHLYQHVKVNGERILKQQLEQISDPKSRVYLQRWFHEELAKRPFGLSYQQISAAPRGIAKPAPGLFILLTNVSLFCRHCGRKEAFAPIW